MIATKSIPDPNHYREQARRQVGMRRPNGSEIEKRGERKEPKTKGETRRER